MPVHAGTSRVGTQYDRGTAFGVEKVNLVAGQIPAHNHLVLAGDAAMSGSPENSYLANASIPIYVNQVGDVPMSNNSIGPTGNGLAHDNIQPYLAMNYIIATQGVYPSLGEAADSLAQENQ